MGLLPCAFCASLLLSIENFRLNDEILYKIRCHNCGINSMTLSDEDRLQKHWNDRSFPWVSIKDDKPPHFLTVLFYDGVDVFSGRREDSCYWNWAAMDYCSPSHWQYMPKPPKDN